jgi:predicted SAM-dependent methyltransferase
LPTLKSRLGAVFIPLLPVNRRSFDILRHELRALRTRVGNTFNPWHHARVSQLNRKRGLSVNVGSGGRGLQCWVNIEIDRHRDTTLCLDVRRQLPFSDGSVRRILIEHVLEHVDFRQDVPVMLRDYHRVLETGGVLRIIVPDAERFVKAYAMNNIAAWKELNWDPTNLPSDIHTPMHVLNHIFHQSGEHMFAYDFSTLAMTLRKAGFKRVEKAAYRTSADPELAIDQENHAPYSLYVEAIK